MYNSPVIFRMELDRMKQTLQVAITQHQASLDQELKNAIDEYCTPENLHKIILQTTRETLDYVIKEEVKKFYTYGEGRKVVADVIRQKLLTDDTFTPLDNNNID